MTIAYYPVINGETVETDGYFEIPGNFTPMFTPGFQFLANDSGGSPAGESATTSVAFTTLSSAVVGGNTQVTPDLSYSPSNLVPPKGRWVSLLGGAYLIEYSDSSKSTFTIDVTKIDQTTTLNLPGRAVLNYGELIDNNFLHMLENFASPTEPLNATEGQFWYDTSVSDNKVPKIYDGSSFVALPDYGSTYWRDPVRVVDSTSSNISNAESSINSDSTPQGISTPLVEGDKILFTAFPGGGSPEGNPNIYVVQGTFPSFTLIEDDNRYPPGQQRGDGVYVLEGDDAHTVYFYTENDIWERYAKNLDDLGDVFYGSPGPVAGDVLTWNGSEWNPSPLPVGTNYHEYIENGSPGQSTIDTGTVNVVANPGPGKSYQQVFLNGILLRENSTGSPINGSPIDGGYYVSGPNQITINPPFAPLSALDEVVIYEL